MKNPVARQDIEKTALSRARGMFELFRLPFGLSNSQSVFQRSIDITLGDAKFNYAVAYVSDVVVFCKNFEDYIVYFEEALQRMKRAGQTMNRRNFSLYAAGSSFLGFIVSLGTVMPKRRWSRPMFSILNRQT